MKILVLHGSMRKGNTYALTQELLNRLSAKPGVEITEYLVSELKLPFCCSCHNCFVRGEQNCPHLAALEDVRKALFECDGIVVSGTTYMWALNAAMKNLLDPFAYLFHRPSCFGKKGLVIATSAGTGEKAVAKYLKTVLGQWGIGGAIVLTQNEKEKSMQKAGEGLSQQKSTEVERAAERLYSLIQSGRYLSPSLKNIAVHNAFRGMSLSGYSGSERDTEFWRQDAFRDRAYPVPVGGFHYFVGALVYRLVNIMIGAVGRSYEKKQR
jgi:multimeric flavodoxin WrbA